MTQNGRGGVQHELKKKDNPLKTYQRTVTGGLRLADLIMYEFIECCISPLPGKPGRFLRSFFYPAIFQRCSKSVKIDKNLTIYQPAKICLSAFVEIEESVTLNVKGSGEGIILRDKVKIGKATILSCPGGKIIIGEGTKIGQKCRLGSLLGLEIGQNCIVGKESYLIGAAHSYSSLDEPIIQQPLTCRGKTIIGDNVNIGSGVTIRDGIRISNGATIANGSLVLNDVAEETRVKGVPAVRV